VWIIQHDWILNRVLLDDSFRPALRYASQTLVSERETLDHMNRGACPVPDFSRARFI
jgi:hypothetical protein